MIKRYNKELHDVIGERALEAISGLALQVVENSNHCYKHRLDGDEPKDCGCNTFWYVSEDYETRYKQEEAKVGDVFYDGNNGDRHVVVAVDLESQRIVVRNETNLNPECLDIVGW